MKETINIDFYESEKFAEYLTIKKQSKKTIQTNMRIVNHFTKWLTAKNTELSEVKHNTLIGYINHCKNKGNTQRTLQVNVTCIRHYYNFLISENHVIENPTTGMNIMGIKRRMLYETFTPDELNTFYKTYANQTPSTGIGSKLILKRNKIILGLVIYQALRSEELARLTPNDIKLQEGKIYVSSSRRTNERELTLEAHQLYDLMDYINETRKALLAITNRQTNNLFISMGTGKDDYFSNIMDKLVRQLKKIDTRIKDIKQVRGSVIVNWLKIHNLRKVQYLAGHRYVSSTEAYQVNNMDDLKEDVSRYHPNF